MTTRKLKDKLSLFEFCAGTEREITSVYCGDLLSWVMSRAKSDCIWITVMTNVNVAAVAVLCDISCIILAEGAKPDEALLSKVKSEEITLFSTDLDVYSLCVKLSELI